MSNPNHPEVGEIYKVTGENETIQVLKIEGNIVHYKTIEPHQDLGKMNLSYAKKVLKSD